MNIAQAIMQLYPEARPFVDFSVRDDSDERGPYIEFWRLPGDPPDAATLAEAWEAAQPAVRLAEVQRTRAAAYPPIGDQLDAIWKGGAEADAMRARIQAVKLKYPKP